jgi:peptidylprolyl isomerase
MKLPTRHLLALGAVSGLLLAGCSSATSDSASPSEAPSASPASSPAEGALPETGGTCDATGGGEKASSGDPLASVGLSDGVDEAPTVSFEAPLAVEAEAIRVATEGDGEAGAEGDLVTFNYIVCDIETGEKLHSTWGLTPEENAPETYTISPSTFGPALAEALSGAPTGTRLLWAQPGISAEESRTGQAMSGQLYAMTVTATTPVPDAATGAEVDVTDASLPVITFEGGKPAVSVPESFTEPTELVVQPLLQGDGPTVEAGQNVVVKYTGWLTDGTQFDSSWDREAPDDVFQFPVGAGNVIQGWDKGVEGQQVGSRLLLVIPSELGYGPSGSGETIPADATLIFVVDILAAY